MRIHFAALAAMLLIAYCSAQSESAIIRGHVLDPNTGWPFANLTVDVFASDDHSSPVATVETDGKGLYAVTVPPGKYYDIYVRTGKENPTQRTVSIVGKNTESVIDFNIDERVVYQSSFVDTYGQELVVGLAALMLLMIVVDQFFLHRKPNAPGLPELKAERDRIQEMLNVARGKYHKREIDEESFREITRDQQGKLIELESKIKALEGK
jgi:uncharacterized membrane protein